MEKTNIPSIGVRIIQRFMLTFARKDNSLRINRLVGLLENWVTR